MINIDYYNKLIETSKDIELKDLNDLENDMMEDINLNNEMSNIEIKENNNLIKRLRVNCIFRLLIIIIIIVIILLLLLIGILLFELVEEEKYNIVEDNTINRGVILNIHGEEKIDMKEYIVSFNKTLRLPNYIYYKLDPIDKKCTTSFKNPKNVNTYKSTSYKGTGFDRSHIVPAIDIHDCKSTYNMINIVPQYPCFNRGIWSTIEKYIRERFVNKKVLTGVDLENMLSIIDNDENSNDEKDYNDEVMYIPKGFFKIVFDDDDNIIYKLYIEHSENSCYKKMDEVCDYNKLPYYLKNGQSFQL